MNTTNRSRNRDRAPREGGIRGTALLVLAVFMLGMFAASCSTTRGASYGGSVSQDSAAAAAAREDDAKKRGSGTPGSPGNQVPSSPYPQPSYSPSPSYHDGNDAIDFWFQLFLALAEAATSGSVVVDGLPPGCVIYVDDHVSAGPSLAVTAGRHALRIECFGYLPWTGVVDITTGGMTGITVSLQKAPFLVDDLRVDPEAFDPGAPGGLGRINLAFRASGPGTVDVELVDASGQVSWSVQDLAITGRLTSLSLDPRDLGPALAPGAYRLHVIARDAEGASSEAWGAIAVSAYRAGTTFASLASGFSGALYAPDARTLPAGRMQADIGAYAQFDPDVAGAVRMPSFAGYRLGLGKSELVASVMEVSYLGYGAYDLDWYSAGLSFKSVLAGNDSTAVSLLLGANYDSFIYYDAAPGWDGPGRYSGVNGGLAFELDSTLTRVFGSVQVQGSDYYPGWGATSAVPGFYTWAYLRAGVELLLPDLVGGQGTFAVSAAGRTSPFSKGFSLTLPLSIGAELHWYAPDSSTVLSVYGSGEWSDDDNWYFGAGLGIGLLL